MLKAIDTPYKGHLFRSRLEARWAVFFDALGVQWEYEVEGYDLGGIWYLPDFRLKTPQGAQHWVEVKPADTTDDYKFGCFCVELHAEEYALSPRADLVSGTPLQWLETNMPCPRCGTFHTLEAFSPLLSSKRGVQQHLVHCELCAEDSPGFEHSEPIWDFDGFLGAPYCWYRGGIVTNEAELINIYHKLKNAAERAQRARFEHGQKG